MSANHRGGRRRTAPVLAQNAQAYAHAAALSDPDVAGVFVVLVGVDGRLRVGFHRGAAQANVPALDLASNRRLVDARLSGSVEGGGEEGFVDLHLTFSKETPK